MTVSTVTKALTEQYAEVVTFDYNSSQSVVSVNKTSKRRMSLVRNRDVHKHQSHHRATYGRMELDSHADTIVLGGNAIIIAIKSATSRPTLTATSQFGTYPSLLALLPLPVQLRV